MARKKPESNKRNIRTVYWQGEQVVCTNSAKKANNAVPNAVRHMQVNEYDATHCEVFDDNTGELHAVIRRKNFRAGTEIEILFKREVKEGM